MKIGVIYCGFNTENYLDASLKPWIEAKNNKLGNNEFVICAISYPFLKFSNEIIDNTQKKLLEYKQRNEIDIFLSGEIPILETTARGEALTALKEQGVDLTIQVDSDEFWTQEQIKTTFEFVNKNPYTAYFRVCYKNYVFSDKQYLVEPFSPARIHRMKIMNNVAHMFWADNNIAYIDPKTQFITIDDNLAQFTIPKNLIWVKHLTWLSDERSKKKAEYQKARGWVCSFAWDNEKGLVWNQEFLNQSGKKIPDTALDS